MLARPFHTYCSLLSALSGALYVTIRRYRVHVHLVISYQAQVDFESDLWIWMQKTSCFVDYIDVTLVDEDDVNSIPSDVGNRAILGNVAIQVMLYLQK